MKIIKYNKNFKDVWDKFVTNAKNKHFFFYRDYMDYHSYKFTDFSLLIYDNQTLFALLPANIDGENVYSHQGLTFAGFVTNEKMKTVLMLEIFNKLMIFLKDNGIKEFEYKAIPYIYHTLPSDEDRYALFRYNAQLYRTDVGTLITQKRIKYSRNRRWLINKARKFNIEIKESNKFDEFWLILEDVLMERHKTKPVHSVDEIKILARKFSNNIKLFVAERDNKILSGSIIFENDDIAHVQYCANSNVGRGYGAVDLLFDYLLNNIYKRKRYFDLGTSIERESNFLNTGLISYKEGFGGRAIVQDYYKLKIL